MWGEGGLFWLGACVVKGVCTVGGGCMAGACA